MLKNIKNFKARNQSGFTIIEVMIVLAVAALIILIVLLAVPALQRSSRNSTIKSTASAVQTAIDNYENDNNGVMPTCAVNSNGTLMVGTTCTTPGTSNETSKIQGSTNLSVITTAPTNGASGNINPGDVQVLFKKACDGTSNTRAAAVYYVTENGGSNNTLQCVDA